MKTKNLSEFKVNGSIDTQFGTELATERIQRALGQKTGGITSFLDTLNFIGFILNMILGIIVFVLVGSYRIILFIVNLFKDAPKSVSPKRDEFDIVYDYLLRGMSTDEVIDLTNSSREFVKSVKSVMND